VTTGQVRASAHVIKVSKKEKFNYIKSKSNQMSKYDLKSKSNHHLESDFKSKSNQIKIINFEPFNYFF
jgi:hypothetical protein